MSKKKNQGQNLKIQPWTSFKVNDLKNGSTKCFENNLKSTHFSQRLISSMNCRSRSNKNQTASAARGEKQRQTWNYVSLELNDKSIEMAETVTKMGSKCDSVVREISLEKTMSNLEMAHCASFYWRGQNPFKKNNEPNVLNLCNQTYFNHWAR